MNVEMHYMDAAAASSKGRRRRIKVRFKVTTDIIYI
jgi:hypothetical protein